MSDPHKPDLNEPASPPHSHHPTGGLEIALDRHEGAGALPAAGRAWWRRIHFGKIALFIASLYLFMLAIVLMKDGMRGIALPIRNLLAIDNAANCLGFGWLFAYTIMSGSPVAAAALTFFDAGVIDRLGAFAMITGSRLGASFIVLLIGFLYLLRGRDRSTSLSMGLLSLLVTGSSYLPGIFIGAFLLQTGALDAVQLRSGAVLSSFIDMAVEPIASIGINLLPDWATFLLGLGIILGSFSLFDRCLPQMTIKDSQLGWMSRLVYRPGIMFILGALVTLVSMSVSLSLSILVPLSARGFVRRENVIPYIMGANVTTFIDTLFAAVLLNNPPAFTIVLVCMASISIVSIVLLLTIYERYQHALLGLLGWVTANNRNLALFLFAIFAIPIILVLI